MAEMAVWYKRNLRFLTQILESLKQYIVDCASLGVSTSMLLAPRAAWMFMGLIVRAPTTMHAATDALEYYSKTLQVQMSNPIMHVI